jgi:hypothetical protein
MPEIIVQKGENRVNILDKIPQLLEALRQAPEMIEELENHLADLKLELESSTEE